MRKQHVSSRVDFLALAWTSWGAISATHFRLKRSPTSCTRSSGGYLARTVGSVRTTAEDGDASLSGSTRRTCPYFVWRRLAELTACLSKALTKQKANWFMADDQSNAVRTDLASTLRSASQSSLMAASSLGKWPRVLMWCDSQPSFQLEWGDGPRNCHAIALGAPVSGDRQRRPRLRAMWHLATDTAQVARRYQEAGEEGLRSESRRPLNSPNRKVSDADRATILRLRAERKGARRIQNDLRLHQQRELSLRRFTRFCAMRP